MQRADFEIYHFRLGTEENHRFEAAAAEAELDMLLGSSETSLSGSMPAGLINETSALKSSNFGFTAPDIGRSTSQDPDSSVNDEPTSSSDDSIDDLLTETSLPRMTRSMGQAMSESMADSVDDLLADTSLSLEEQKLTANQQTLGTPKGFESFG